MDESAKDNLLRSWKEIAAYLGYDQRTCYRWEQKFGMPVHRAEGGGTKSRVVAYKDELDRWFQTTFTNGSRQTPAKLGRRPVLKWALIGLVPVVAAAAIFLILRTRPPRPGQPADFHLRGSKLIILDEDGNELWRRDIRIDGLYDEAEYRDYFQVARREILGQNLAWLAIKDIDGDGQNEVLFVVRRITNAYGEGLLICYNSRGDERWRFKAGREMVYGGRTYSADYRIHGFSLHDVNGDGRQEIFVPSYHYPWEPCQLAVLDSRGKLTGEFWNAGYISDIAFADLDGSGRELLFAAGVNNEYGGGCLIVFDPADVHGASPQDARHSYAGVAAGSEKYYIDFPRSDVSLADSSAVVAGNVRVEITSNRRLQVTAHWNLVYEFGAGMRCLNVSGGHGFITTHKAFTAQGKLRSTLDDAYYEAQRLALRYWDGAKWAAEPTPNLGNAAIKK